MIEPPATIEICPRCRAHVLYLAACYHCGFKGDGVRYELRKDEGA